MSTLNRIWDWLLPGLISLNQVGAFAYYVAQAEEEEPHIEPRNPRLHVLVAA